MILEGQVSVKIGESIQGSHDMGVGTKNEGGDGPSGPSLY